MKTTITIEGLDELDRFLRKKSKEIIERADDGITQSIFFMEGEIKESIAGRRAEPKSVDTGQFMNSIKASKTGKMEGKVETDLSYPVYLEYGTSKIAPRRHFENSISRNVDKIKIIVQTEVAKI